MRCNIVRTPDVWTVTTRRSTYALFKGVVLWHLCHLTPEWPHRVYMASDISPDALVRDYIDE